MFTNPQRPPRPRLTLPIFFYALADVFGLFCVATGASWFAAGKATILKDFPTSTAEAVACAAGGAVVMFWAASRILRELGRQAPEMEKRYEDYVATHHPDKARKTPPEAD